MDWRVEDATFISSLLDCRHRIVAEYLYLLASARINEPHSICVELPSKRWASVASHTTNFGAYLPSVLMSQVYSVIAQREVLSTEEVDCRRPHVRNSINRVPKWNLDVVAEQPNLIWNAGCSCTSQLNNRVFKCTIECVDRRTTRRQRYSELSCSAGD